MKRFALLSLFLLLGTLSACVPVAQYPPDTPVIYPTSYRNLFSTTLQELTAAYLPSGLGRSTFSVTQANLETGLITAVRNERGASANVQYRYRYPEDDADIGNRSGSFFPGLGLALTLPVQTSSPDQTIITIVLRKVGNQASLIYSTQGPDGTSSNDGTRLMRIVVADLNARFLAPEQPAVQPETP